MQYPMQNPITVNVPRITRYTTLIKYNNRYYYNDGLVLAIPNTLTQLHKHLWELFGGSQCQHSCQVNHPEYLPHTPRDKHTNGDAQCTY